MFKFYTFFLLCSLCASSAEFKHTNQFLDAYPLNASDGRHSLEEQIDMNVWAGNNREILHSLQGSMFAFSPVQVVRGTKAVAFLTPQVFYNNSLFDLSKFPIWKQLFSEIEKTKNIKIYIFESSIPIIYELQNGMEITNIQTVSSFIFINTSLPNWETILNYLKHNKRNSMVHPKDDVNFILEGYLLGYSLANIETFYHREDAERKTPFDVAHPQALQKLKNLGFEVETLRSGHKKFTVEFEEIKNPCAHCQKSDASKICSRCRKVRYCGRECQISHWEKHKNECSKK